MNAPSKKLPTAARCWALGLALTAVGCTVPTYSHTVVTKYDANGNLIGTEERESISQPQSTSSPFKVRLTQRAKLEE